MAIHQPTPGCVVIVEGTPDGPVEAVILKSHIHTSIALAGFGLVDVALKPSRGTAPKIHGVLLFSNREQALLSGQQPVAYFPDRAEEERHAA